MNLGHDENYILAKAISVLKGASSENGIKASSELTDNYNRVWARDSAVAGLAILSNQIEELYLPLESSIRILQKAAAVNGQIPSNVTVNADGEMTGVSFGGPVGRTDAGFWWVIITLQFLNQKPQEQLKSIAYHQANAIFKLADSWEFNQKNLMYVPMSSNWADEYVTHGYVLYDQILRFWALDLAGSFFNRDDWKEKALAIKTAIKQHYLLELELSNSLFTEAQKIEIKNFDLEKQFIASFSPGDIVDRFDTWSVGLLLLLKIPSEESALKLEKATKKIFELANQKGMPAFYPLIKEDESLFNCIKLNHSYHFKNHPGHFHNGGIWPVVNGFLIAGLNQNGLHQTAKLLHQAMDKNLMIHLETFPFAEYFDFEKSIPGGVKNLCYSASGYLLAEKSLSAPSDFKKSLFSSQIIEEQVNLLIREKVSRLIQEIGLEKNKSLTISIAGESGCGKTTLSRSIKELLEQSGKRVLILHQDEYFKLPPKQNHAARELNFEGIGPQEVRLSLLDSHIKKIKQAEIQTLAIPHMDWVNDTEEVKFIDVRNIDLIIIEGTYTSLLHQIDHRIFINTNYKSTKKNREIRNRESITDFIEMVLEKESAIIHEHLKLADIVLDAQLNILSH